MVHVESVPCEPCRDCLCGVIHVGHCDDCLALRLRVVKECFAIVPCGDERRLDIDFRCHSVVDVDSSGVVSVESHPDVVERHFDRPGVVESFASRQAFGAHSTTDEGLAVNVAHPDAISERLVQHAEHMHVVADRAFYESVEHVERHPRRLVDERKDLGVRCHRLRRSRRTMRRTTPGRAALKWNSPSACTSRTCSTGTFGVSCHAYFHKSPIAFW